MTTSEVNTPIIETNQKMHNHSYFLNFNITKITTENILFIVIPQAT